MLFRYTLLGKIRQKIQATGDGHPYSGCDNALQRYVGDIVLDVPCHVK